MKKSLRRTIENTIDAVINSIWFEELRILDVPIRPFIYPLIAALTLISGFATQDPVWKTAVAAILFFLIPEIIGGGILSLIELTREEPEREEQGFLENWAAGVITTFILFFLIAPTRVSLLKPIFITLIILGLVTRLVLPYLKYAKTFKTAEYDEEIKDKILIVLTTLVLAVAGYAIWKSSSPYPLPLNWDIHEHQTLINEIKSGNLHFLNSRISDSFIVDGYSPLFHILLATPQIIISKARILGFWWFTEFLQYLLTIAAGGFLAWRLTKDRLTTITTVIITTLVFESFISYSPLFLIPQTLAAILTILTLTRGLKRLEKRLSFFDPIQVLLMIIILLTHYIVGLLGIAVLMAGSLTRWLRKEKVLGIKLVDLALILSIFVLITFPATTYYIDIELLQYAEAQHFNLDLLRKWELMRNWYGYSLLAFTPVGVLAVLKSKNAAQKTSLIICFGTLALVIAKIPYSLKFYALGGFFVHFLIAAGITALLKLINSQLLRAVFLMLVTLSFGLVFTLNQNYYKGILHYGELTTQLSINEMKAAYWLEENYDRQKGVILISDPATQGIMEALSGINSQGGVYTNLATRRVIDQTYPNSDSAQVANLLFSVRDTVKKENITKVLFVISGRFFKWQEATIEEKEAIFFNIWRPADLSPQDKRYVNALRLNPKFQPVYQNPGLVVFEVRK